MSKDKNKDPKDTVLEEEKLTDSTVEEQVDSPTETDTQSSDSESSTDGNELDKLMKEKQGLQDKYLRLLAEFENYKKRTVKERIDLLNTAAKDTLTVLLPVLDDFDRAQGLSEEQKATPAFQEGIQLVYQKLNNVLKQKGLEVMESTGLPFDPELHEALTEIPAPTEDLKGKVVDTIEKGYSLKGKIIRHAKVVTGK